MPLFTFFWFFLLAWGSGWLFFPFARRLFAGHLPDDGLQVGRVVFVALWTMSAFLLGFAGVPVGVSALLYFVFAAASGFVWWRERATLRSDLKAKKRAIWSGEALFVLVFLLFFGLRGFWSDTSGNNGEKGMDGALVASLSRTQKLPPPNVYAAGARLQSYYYGGHLSGALWTRASGTTMRWSYNLLCALLPALCFGTLWSLGAALTGRLRGGFFVTGAVLVLGTLQPIIQWLNGVERLDPFAVSRVIPFSINEFPFFTFNQADLHAHYFSMPLQLALIATAWAIWRQRSLILLGITALLLGTILITNTWDFPVYALLISAATLAGARRKGEAGAVVVATWLGAIVLAAPFLLGVRSAAGTPKPLPQPASPLREWLLLWGVVAAAWWLFAAYSMWRDEKTGRWMLAAVAGGVLLAAFISNWGAPAALVLPLVVANLGLGIAGWIHFAGKDENQNDESQKTEARVETEVAPHLNRHFNIAARFVCALGVFGLLALVWSETTWAGFLGNPDHDGFDDFKRQDTVFKFGMQTWLLWGTASAVGAILTWRRWPIVLRLAFVPALTVMLFSSLIFASHRARGFTVWDGWDAWAHLSTPEQEAARWLETHVESPNALLEAEQQEGGDYSVYTRYAHATGIPTIIGPQAHSFQWSPANSGDPGIEWPEVFKRKEAARQIYTSPDDDLRRRLAAQYGVQFIVWGELEREQYLDAFELLKHTFPVVQSFGSVSDPRSVTIFDARPEAGM